MVFLAYIKPCFDFYAQKGTQILAHLNKKSTFDKKIALSKKNSVKTATF
jgi:hypothetical protein